MFAENPEGFVKVFRDTLASGGIILQSAVSDFEKRLAQFVGCEHAVGTSDCTNAMLLGLRAAGIGSGDEVIFCSHTFVATAQSIHFAGATPVPVEVGLDRMVDPASIEAAISDRTRAIMVTQLNGRVCDMAKIRDLSRRRNLVIFEDAAQALGASFEGQRAGSFGVFGGFSFYPSKVFGTFGDAGALTTRDEALADRVFRMRNHGANREKQLEVDSPIWGTNSRLDNLQAAFLNYKFGRFPQTVARRRQIARTYHKAFEELPDFRRPPGPDDDNRHFDVYQNYEIEAVKRDELRRHLQANGVGTIIQWGGAGVHQMRGLGFTQELPVTDLFFERCLLLPMNQFLSDRDILHVCSTVRSFYGLSAWKDVAEEFPGDAPRESLAA